ncbi:MAG: WG repeat-containing protein [Bacteroidetes bacterium]|nr:WG repeat-containing protein [Bacteroidota bacterium]
MKHLENGQWRFGKMDVWGLCDANGKVLLPREYESISPIGDLVWVKKNGLEGLNSSTGKVIFPAEFVKFSP